MQPSQPSPPSANPTAQPTETPSTTCNAQATLNSLRQNFTCDLCRDIFTAPVRLPCDHIFCSACIRLHFTMRSQCPSAACHDSRETVTTASLTPLRHLDRSLLPLRTSPTAAPSAAPDQHELQYMPFLLCLKDAAARHRFTTVLRQLGLVCTGKLTELANRHKNFVIAWNANVDSAFPRAKADIAAQITADERKARMAQSRASNRPFFQRRRSAPSDPIPTPSSDSLMPAEGDDHNTLIFKLRQREQLVRDAAGLPPRPCKRVRTESPPPVQGVDRNSAVNTNVDEITPAQNNSLEARLDVPDLVQNERATAQVALNSMRERQNSQPAPSSQARDMSFAFNIEKNARASAMQIEEAVQPVEKSNASSAITANPAQSRTETPFDPSQSVPNESMMRSSQQQLSLSETYHASSTSPTLHFNVRPSSSRSVHDSDHGASNIPCAGSASQPSSLRMRSMSQPILSTAMSYGDRVEQNQWKARSDASINPALVPTSSQPPQSPRAQRPFRPNTARVYATQAASQNERRILQSPSNALLNSNQADYPTWSRPYAGQLKNTPNVSGPASLLYANVTQKPSNTSAAHTEANASISVPGLHETQSQVLDANNTAANLANKSQSSVDSEVIHHITLDINNIGLPADPPPRQSSPAAEGHRVQQSAVPTAIEVEGTAAKTCPSNRRGVSPQTLDTANRAPYLTPNGSSQESHGSSAHMTESPFIRNTQNIEQHSQICSVNASLSQSDNTPLTAEQLRRINQNKLRAIERRRQFQRRRQMENSCSQPNM